MFAIGVSSWSSSMDKMVDPPSGRAGIGAPSSTGGSASSTGGSAAQYGSLNPSAEAPYQGQDNWNTGFLSQGNGDMAGFYPQVHSSGGLLPQSESYDMQGLPHEVSEPYPATFIVQTEGGYKRLRMSATKDTYSRSQEFGVEPEDWSTDLLPSSNKG